MIYITHYTYPDYTYHIIIIFYTYFQKLEKYIYVIIDLADNLTANQFLRCFFKTKFGRICKKFISMYTYKC